MAGMTRSSVDLDTRRRKALFRSWHRGTREMDLVLGQFADAKIGELNDADLADFELLMEAPDRDVFAWLTGSEETPANYDTAVYRSVKAFHEAQEKASS